MSTYESYSTGRGNGYCYDAWKSNNALYAEGDGRYPKTLAVKVLKAHYGRKYTTQQLLDLIDATPTAEWHHTSGAYNETPYFDTKELIEGIDDGSIVVPPKRTKEKTVYQTVPVSIEWEEWETSWNYGRRKYKKVTDTVPNGFIRFKKGAKMVDIHLSDGSFYARKKLEALAIYTLDPREWIHHSVDSLMEVSKPCQ